MVGPGETEFARSGDLSIAYQVVGDGPIDLVYVPGFMSHVELNWEFSFTGPFLREMAEFSRLIILDKRGTGLSDRSLGLGTFEERMDDVRAVMDAAGSERAALIGISEGGAMSALMAATHPDRVSSLVLGAAAYPGQFGRVDDAVLDFIEGAWNTGKVLEWFVQHAPDRDAARHELARFERYCCTPTVAREIMRRTLDSDIRSVVPTVDVPTLVVQNRGDPVVPFAHAEAYAADIPGATLVALDGDFHGSWEPAHYAEIVAAVRSFLVGEATARPASIDRVLSTVLFTDIVGSTVQASEVGDARWRQLLDGHDDAAAQEVSAHGGVLVKSTGDGILARFDGPSRAVACAHALQQRAHALGLEVRAGAHTGEVELRGDDVSGMAVHIASRVADVAGAGEVVVSSTVKDLTIGSSLQFADRGEHELKGVPDRWRLYAASL